MKVLSTVREITVKYGHYVFMALLAVYGGYIVFGDDGYMHLQRMKAELAEIRTVNAAAEEENTTLYHSVSRLKNDPAYIEHVIREQLQMNSPTEIIFKFNEKPSP